MTQFLNYFFLVIGIASFLVTVLFGIFGIYEDIMGPDDAKRLLKKMNIPLSYKQVLIIGFASLTIMFIAWILRDKLLGSL